MAHREIDADPEVQAQAREMSACGDLRTCQDCGAWVCYLFTQREWTGHAAPCGKWTLATKSCPQRTREIVEVIGGWHDR